MIPASLSRISGLPTTARALSLSITLAFLAGFVDTAVFIQMGGLFVAHVTGNFVLLGAQVVGVGLSHGNATTSLLQFISFPSFFLGAVLAATVSPRLPRLKGTRVLLWVVVVMTGAGAGGSLLGLIADGPLAVSLAFAMGILNAAHRLDSALGPPFTVMTGNVTGVAIEAASWLRLAPRKPGPSTAVSPPITVYLVVAFALGCGAGAAGQQALQLGAMVIPAALLAARLMLR